MGKSKISKYPKIIKKLSKEDYATIKTDLNNQLRDLGKIGKHYDDLVNEYLRLLTIREALNKDIQDKGIRYTFTNGNGIDQERANESVGNLIKVEQLLLKIINDLGINQPVILSQSSSTQQSNKASDSDEEDLL